MAAPPRVIPQRRDHVSDPALARVDQAREDLARVLTLCPFVRGKLVSVTFLATTPKSVTHGLGVPAGFIVVRNNYGGSGVATDIAENDATYQAAIDQRQQISLYSSVASTVDLWFYPRASKTIDTNLGQSK